jgi:hypothetical protein
VRKKVVWKIEQTFWCEWRIHVLSFRRYREMGCGKSGILDLVASPGGTPAGKKNVLGPVWNGVVGSRDRRSRLINRQVGRA